MRYIIPILFTYSFSITMYLNFWKISMISLICRNIFEKSRTPYKRLNPNNLQKYTIPTLFSPNVVSKTLYTFLVYLKFANIIQYIEPFSIQFPGTDCTNSCFTNGEYNFRRSMIEISYILQYSIDSAFDR